MGFVDDFVQGINREINKVQNRGQEMMQTYQLNSQIRVLEGKKAAALIEIGRLVYEKYQRGIDVPDEKLADKAKEIAGFEHEVTVLQAELEQIRVQFDPNKPASQRAEAKAGYSTTPGFTCPHCKAPASREKAFCPACGGSLAEAGGVQKAEAESGENGDQED